jgi:hypothetical protein
VVHGLVVSAKQTQGDIPEQRFARRAAISSHERDQMDIAIATLRVATKDRRRTMGTDALDRQAIASALKQFGV